ncbi:MULTISPECIES: hypothetical protein [unclassified Lactobacillus]|uniref:hypothetical protein n=1 Tax=unclassified Lactobacillus TaxID=2620435 RepID=UPI0022697E0F|nr:MULTISPECIES: hypothetical protein [unclassified Lactobacillus]MCX8720599.1 hypothetical protein [Lactobacillus sp. B4010]MCX8723310.1 hypothetical protein [Lactobacillus sp. B4005]MCX8724550.1 hypothetical protein [Lactobacillus sp. B4007]MCX8731378.1 hypothetical protein [Lactobacillus sp. B4015]MCX8733599.1 hypothetical protein [Lactobacillus sp. B4012]
MKKNFYKITTFLLTFLLTLSLFFLLKAIRKPPSVFGDFSNNLNPGNNVRIALGIHQKSIYRLYFKGTEFDRGIIEKSSEYAYILKSKKGTNGTLILTSRDSYLYYPNLKDKVIIVKKVSDVPTITK